MNDVALALPAGSVLLRRATIDDLPTIIDLLADDPISAARGDSADAGDREAYESAFAAIDSDPAQRLLVAVDAHGSDSTGVVVATMQLTVIPGLARRGSSRLQIEAVRVSSSQRNRGIGAAMMRWALADARAAGVPLVQLTSDAARVDAHRFYERLGFEASHVGFKYRVLSAEH
ncbi:GNAT family N-acetyltransferase [Agreia pratensis]|uniref:Ribosomal protein S18 acetylase RimI n=1 Tax=Agreia pratensis TaxID=150121 RepID=A0A1X7KGJ8_9MICO|nr:GNAT family N-acetyltransferase [Agreia pratensis]MBF4634800.1 GNAT family N-acetyltransferase [Agreia pratensis]SMG40397.1 Ribosomal protein S18 acetylase RimI [Agreia pratensis]